MTIEPLPPAERTLPAMLARAALEVADYGYVLEMGEVALQGPAEDLAKDPRVIETYLGAARKKTEA